MSRESRSSMVATATAPTLIALLTCLSFGPRPAFYSRTVSDGGADCATLRTCCNPPPAAPCLAYPAMVAPVRGADGPRDSVDKAARSQGGAFRHRPWMLRSATPPDRIIAFPVALDQRFLLCVTSGLAEHLTAWLTMEWSVDNVAIPTHAPVRRRHSMPFQASMVRLGYRV